MVFDANFSILYSDTLIPDVFISEYMPSLESDFIKVYIYCLFLSKYRKNPSSEMIAKKLELQADRVKDALTRLEDLGLITRSADGDTIRINDIKEKKSKKFTGPRSRPLPRKQNSAQKGARSAASSFPA